MSDFFLFFYLLFIAPKLLFDRLFLGKRHPHFLKRLGFSLPDPQGKEVIWIHAVSVGEVKAAQSLFRELRKKKTDAFFFVTTTTVTGQAEARRSLPEANAYSFAPLDFSWNVRRWVRALRPKLFLLVETDFWPNLLAAVKRGGGKTALVSGKLSSLSAKRFRLLTPLSRRLFSHFDLLCVQSEEYRARFRPLVSDPTRLLVTGNLKLDLKKEEVDLPFWEKKISPASQWPIAITCTHSPEEEELLKRLFDFDLFFFLAPRHPERFPEVAKLLERRSIPFFRWSNLEKRRGGERVLLVDAMGVLPICYSLSRLALVGGSFFPGVGGHNILEPCLYGIPVFFGPHMSSQTQLASYVLHAKAGIQAPLSSLRSHVEELLKNPLRREEMKQAAEELMQNCHGATHATLQALKGIF